MLEFYVDNEYRDKVRVFKDRLHAGRILGSMLESLGWNLSCIVAVPSGGVPVALACSSILRLKVYVCPVRKILFPWTTEAGFGAVSYLGVEVYDRAAADWIGRKEFRKALEAALESVNGRVKLYSKFLVPNNPGDVVIVDDGLATGFTMLAAVKTARMLNARSITVAVPTASESAVQMLRENVDRMAILNLRGGYTYAVADAYTMWRDIPEEEALRMLKETVEANNTLVRDL